MLLLKDLSAGYGRVQVLRDVTLAVPAGTVVALLGPNGAGKTTLLRAASGLISPSAGHILLDDEDVTTDAPERLVSRGICHVGEGRAVFRGLSVRENLRMFAVPGQEEELTDRAVLAFPVLGRRLNQVAGTMSGGEQQMLALSRAHRSDVKLVLLDEVSMGLAPKVVNEIFEFLSGLCRGGSSLLLVEQYAERALALADLVFVLNRGRCVFAGEPREISHDDLFNRYMAASA